MEIAEHAPDIWVYKAACTHTLQLCSSRSLDSKEKQFPSTSAKRQKVLDRRHRTVVSLQCAQISAESSTGWISSVPIEAISLIKEQIPLKELHGGSRLFKDA